MGYKVLFMLNALVALVVGVGFLIKPDLALPFLGITEQYAATVWTARYFGSAMIGLGLVLWFAQSADEKIQKGMGWGLFACSLIGLILTAFATFAGNAVIRQNVWIPLGAYALFALGYALMLFMKPKSKQ